MLKIGITGNIGSGKTTVSQVFEILGIPVFYADYHAKNVMVTDAELVSSLQQTFGNQAYFDDGTLNRSYLAGIVFNNQTQLQKLNALVHPAVFRAFDNWALQHTAAPYVLKEAAILFESGSYLDCNFTVLVTAPATMRVARVMQRDGITETEAISRDSKQMPQEEKETLASFMIKNDNSELVIPTNTGFTPVLFRAERCPLMNILNDFLAFNHQGLYCRYGNFYLDPQQPVEHAVISHAHGDHAVPGNQNVYCTTPHRAVYAITLW